MRLCPASSSRRVASQPANEHERMAWNALLRLGKRASFTAWLKASGLAESTFKRAVHGMATGGLVVKRPHGARHVYEATREALDQSLDPTEGEGPDPNLDPMGEQ